MKNKMKLGVILDQGGSIQSMIDTGQGNRFIHSYLERYAKTFDEVIFFSYKNENHPLPSGCTLVPAKIKTKAFIYSFLMPFLSRREFKTCNVFRVLQMSGAIPAIIGKIIWGIPFIATYGYNYFEKFKTQMRTYKARIMNIFINIGIKFANAIIVSSENILGYVQERAQSNKVFFIPNGVELKLFKSKKEYKNNSKKTNICFIGRLSKDKNLFVLIDALSILSGRDITLILIGTGPLKEALENYAQKKGICTDFKGIVPYENLSEILINADIFVLSSFMEGHPKALTDAMACGLPCIGTNVNGTRELIIDGENGLLCELNSEDLAQKINILLEDSALAQRLGMNARKYVEENYDLERLLQKEIMILVEKARQNV